MKQRFVGNGLTAISTYLYASSAIATIWQIHEIRLGSGAAAETWPFKDQIADSFALTPSE